GGQCGRDDALRLLRDGPDDERDRGLRHGSRHREGLTAMLRKALLGVALLLFAAGLWLTAAGEANAHPRGAWGGGLLRAVLRENWRYRSRRGAIDPGWVRTDERFVDPASAEPLEVWYDPRTGDRRYEKADGRH